MQNIEEILYEILEQTRKRKVHWTFAGEKCFKALYNNKEVSISQEWQPQLDYVNLKALYIFTYDGVSIRKIEHSMLKALYCECEEYILKCGTLRMEGMTRYIDSTFFWKFDEDYPDDG